MSRPALAALPVVGVLPILATPALAKPAKKLAGVQAWTSGSQTYLRVRPAQNTPIVAKVAKHTPLFVWGKYKGWYRVETQDHMFGWVHYDLVNSPALGKVKELSPTAAKRASERNGTQTLWGEPEQLTAYFKKHGAPGAVAGLREMGVKVTIGSKAQPKKVAAKPAAKPKAAKVSAAKPAAKPVAKAAVQKVVAPKPAAQAGASPTTRAAAPRIATPRIAAPRAAAPRKATPVAAKPQPVVRAVKAPVANAANAANAATGGASAVTPVKLLPAPPQRVVSAKKTAKSEPAKKVSQSQNARDQKRQQLRARMGMNEATPPLPIGDIAPVSPEELMKARRAYLEARKKKFGSNPDAKDATPPADDSMGGPKVTPSSFEWSEGDNQLDAQGWAPFNARGWSARDNGPRFADWDSSRAPGFRLVIEDEEMDNGELGDWAKLPALESLEVQTVDNAKKKPAAKADAKAAPSRGGSPRDRYKDQKGDFRKNMANQALSYRGRPYIRGAASPSRGFDCSGLIYYLLRQRGYNPPRTAAGFAKYGTPVARGKWQPGDLLLFANTYKRGVSHIGMYLGDNKFVHAASTRQGVRVDSMNTKYYANKYHSARRVPTK